MLKNEKCFQDLVLGNTPHWSKQERVTAMKPKFSCLRKLLNQYKGKVLEGIGKLLPSNHVSVTIVITKHRQKSSSLITEMLPNSLMRILQDLFHRLQLQEK